MNIHEERHPGVSNFHKRPDGKGSNCLPCIDWWRRNVRTQKDPGYEARTRAAWRMRHPDKQAAASIRSVIRRSQRRLGYEL